MERVLALGSEGVKFHPLHVVKGTQLANSWRRGEYQGLSMDEYVATVCDLIEMSPPELIIHRLTGTAQQGLLLTPDWCVWKWRVINAIEAELDRRQALPSPMVSDLQQGSPHVPVCTV
jgi:radical SAM superfamily enzyme